ncbi:MAG TPA: hypothetical protein VFR61_07215, partial [Nitrososphaeraceae archaeon]|nr:hypothetical protein [Nitrososphaeraceae archaeon]
INQKFAYFSILMVSILFVFAQGISSNYLVLSAEGSQHLNKAAKIITIQDNSENEKEESEDANDDNNNEGSSVSNETGLAGAGSLSGDTTISNVTTDEGLGEDANQTLQSENEVNQNVSQTTNQNVNVNQTTNQNVNIQNKQKLELIISEEEGEAPISIEEQTRIESQDKIIITEHKGITGPECKPGNVLEGASNAEDLRVLAECQDAIGTVMHTKKMDDGDYKFFLDVDEQFKFLVNDKNNEKTEGFLVVEIVPPHQDGMYLPKDGDRVHLWGAWVTDEPKGWHEIHPTWKVLNQ